MWKKITVIYNSITNEGTIKKVWVLFYFPHNLRHNIYIYIYIYIYIWICNYKLFVFKFILNMSKNTSSSTLKN